jgi:hypothetical protein
MLALAPPLAGCGQDQAAPPANSADASTNSAAAATDPVAAAQRMVRQRLRGGEVRFAEARIYRSGSVPVVCGSYAQPGAANLRYLAVSEADVWMEPEIEREEMDRHYREFCRDRANA